MAFDTMEKLVTGVVSGERGCCSVSLCSISTGVEVAKLRTGRSSRVVSMKIGSPADFRRAGQQMIDFSPRPRFQIRRQIPLSCRCNAQTSAPTISNSRSRTERTRPILPPPHPTYKLLDVIRHALAEDGGDRGDITCLSTIPAGTKAKAQFVAKADGIIAGIELAQIIFREVDPQLEMHWDVEDGDEVRIGLRFGTVRGNARSILVAERVVLNFMQRMSGIATVTKRMSEAASPARILDTRKTAPGLRLIDKWAVLIGAGENHRMGLYDMMLVKDNHIDVAGGIKNALDAVDNYLREEDIDVGVEIETRTLEEVEEVLECISNGKGRVTRIMLDNMVKLLPGGDVDVSMLQKAINLVNGRVDTEASGNVTLETVKDIGATGVTFISSGALTHSVVALDISLTIDTRLDPSRDSVA